MGLLDVVYNKFGIKRGLTNNSSYARSSSRVIEDINDFGGARVTKPSFTKDGGGGAFQALPKKAQRELSLDERSFLNQSLSDLIDTFIDAHPDLSFAVWNFVRMSNSGYTITVEKLNGNPYPQGEKQIKELILRMKTPNVDRFEKNKSFNKVINQLLLSVVTRGACSGELVLSSGKNDVLFIAVVDPATIDFKLEGDRYVPLQFEEISLDIPTFFYEGLDEKIDDPYGRSPLLSAIAMILFQLQVLNDIKAVVHNQGYPRYDINIVEEVLLKRMPISIRNNEERKQKWLNDKLKEIIDMYNSLEPDDAFVHYDSVEIDMVGAGGKGGGVTLDPEKLMSTIDNLIMSGLKTLSTILGRRSNGNTESFAKIETKLYLKGVEAIQECVEELLGRAFTYYLNLTGKQGVVTFKFNAVEIRTEIEKAQFEQIALLNYAFMRDQGWIDQEEAALLAVGHAPVGEPNWEALGKGMKNKDGETPSGTRDEKVVDSPSEEAD